MRLLATAWIAIALASRAMAQPPGTVSPDFRLAKAEALIDAFYSFDPHRLRRAMAHAPNSVPDTLYYQPWAEAGHYRVLKRSPCRWDNENEASCAITVKDDLVPALGLTSHVTDVFHMAFRDGEIVKVWNTSDDPPEYWAGKEWLKHEHPEIFTGPCRDMFAGGPTPGDCIRALIDGLSEYTKAMKADRH
jgi:hypothetical protein